jgi:hypothetical protein
MQIATTHIYYKTKVGIDPEIHGRSVTFKGEILDSPYYKIMAYTHSSDLACASWHRAKAMQSKTRDKITR